MKVSKILVFSLVFLGCTISFAQQYKMVPIGQKMFSPDGTQVIILKPSFLSEGLIYRVGVYPFSFKLGSTSADVTAYKTILCGLFGNGQGIDYSFEVSNAGAKNISIIEVKHNGSLNIVPVGEEYHAPNNVILETLICSINKRSSK